MSRRKDKSIPASIVVYPDGASPLDPAMPHCDFESDNPGLIEAHESDLRYFREHLGTLVRTRKHIVGEFTFMEGRLPPIALVEATILADGRVFRRPFFLRDMQ